MQAIAEKDNDDPIFKSEILEHILNFKWKYYAKKEYFFIYF